MVSALRTHRGYPVLLGCRYLILLVAALMGSGTAFAAAMPAGTSEVGAAGQFSHASYSHHGRDSGSWTYTQLSLSYGHCVTDLVELRGSFLWEKSSVDYKNGPSSRVSSFGGAGSILLNFQSGGAAVPYLKGGVGALGYAGSSNWHPKTSILFPMLGGGLRFLVGDSAALDAGVQYQHVFNADGENDLTADQVLLGLGVSLILHEK